MSTDDEGPRWNVPRVGSASAEPVEETPKEPPKTEAEVRVRLATYDGMDEDEATRAWKRETLCATCVCANVCRVATVTGETMVVVARCLAYIPSPE